MYPPTSPLQLSLRSTGWCSCPDHIVISPAVQYSYAKSHTLFPELSVVDVVIGCSQIIHSRRVIRLGPVSSACDMYPCSACDRQLVVLERVFKRLVSCELSKTAIGRRRLKELSHSAAATAKRRQYRCLYSSRWCHSPELRRLFLLEEHEPSNPVLREHISISTNVSCHCCFKSVFEGGASSLPRRDGFSRCTIRLQAVVVKPNDRDCIAWL